MSKLSGSAKIGLLVRLATVLFFDAMDGEMKGMLSLSIYTPAVTFWPPRGEFYAAESYLARGVYGERTDIVAIYDYENLSPIAEIEIPNYMARLQVRSHMGLLNNGRHLAVLNMNPGHSVSIVDVEDRIFTHEASTPGCAVIMPVAQNDFMQFGRWNTAVDPARYQWL